jgi:ectoine hydroxylase-related dioxygenase (phytanoyl-CoA dioxygenase family)
MMWFLPVSSVLNVVPSGSASRTAQLAAELSTFGLTVLCEPQLDGAQVERLRQHSSERLDWLLGEITNADVDPVEQHYTFTEIAHRQRMRWDVRLPEGDALWATACDAAIAAATPVIQHLHPPEAAHVRTLMSGVLISRPGATAQRWHVDCDAAHLERAAADPRALQLSP